jgi:hypothetical protein
LELLLYTTWRVLTCWKNKKYIIKKKWFHLYPKLFKTLQYWCFYFGRNAMSPKMVGILQPPPLKCPINVLIWKSFGIFAIFKLRIPMQNYVVRVVTFIVNYMLFNMTHKPPSPNYISPHQTWVFIKWTHITPITKHYK